MRALPLLFLVLGCPSNPPCEPAADSGSGPGPMRADGLEIRDELDRLVTLRGVNFGGRSKFAPYGPVEFDADAADPLAAYLSVLDPTLDTLVDWGVSTLRVPWSWAALEPTEGSYDEDWLARLDALMDAAAARRLAVILDFHQDLYAEPLCGDGFPAWTLPDPGPPQHDCPNWFLGYFSDPEVLGAFDRLWANEDGVLDALGARWAFLVARYADHPAVVGYEPMNEPGWGSMDREEFTRDVLAAWYARIVPELAALDPDALFFLDLPGTDRPDDGTAMARPDLDGIVFAPHYYHPSLVLGDDAPTLPTDISDDLAGWAQVGVDWQVPVLLGEFGIPNGRAGELPFIRSHYDTFDALGMHSTHWEVSRATELWNGEDLSLMTSTGRAQAVVDEVARPYVRALAGRGLELAVDMEEGVAEARWADPDGGVTELIVPNHRWGGSEVEVEGGCIAAQEGTRLQVRATEASTRVTLRRPSQ